MSKLTSVIISAAGIVDTVVFLSARSQPENAYRPGKIGTIDARPVSEASGFFTSWARLAAN